VNNVGNGNFKERNGNKININKFSNRRHVNTMIKSLKQVFIKYEKLFCYALRLGKTVLIVENIH